ncbi:MAG: PIN domain-containing protein [Patescibacteria group bacterium]
MQEDINIINTYSVSIDASVLISAIGVKDVFTPSSRKFFSQLSNKQRVIISIVAAAETLVVLSRQKAASGDKTLDYLEQFQIVPLDLPHLKEIFSVFPNRKLKTSDFLIAATAVLHQTILVTWDKQLLSPANTICQTMTPSQYIEECTTK